MSEEFTEEEIQEYVETARQNLREAISWEASFDDTKKPLAEMLREEADRLEQEDDQ